MYVNWLLQFVWIIFVQGPLLVIKGLQSFITKLFGLDLYSFFQNQGSIANKIFLTYGFYLMISIFIGIMVFICRMIMVFLSDDIDSKPKIIKLSKGAGKGILLVIGFPILFMGFIAFLGAINLVIFNIFKNDRSFVFELSDNISDYYLNNKTMLESNFAINEEGFKELQNVNFIVQIGSSLIGMSIMIWFFWNFIQKIIEIFILFLSYPIIVGATLGDGEIKRKILINEILNKALIFLTTIIFYSLFITILQVANKIITEIPQVNEKNIGNLKPILKFVFLFITSTSIISMNWFFSKSIRQHNGVLQSLNSIKQTGSFTKNLYQEKIKVKYEYKQFEKNNSNINLNVESLRTDLKNNKNNNTNKINGLKKIKIYKT